MKKFGCNASINIKPYYNLYNTCNTWIAKMSNIWKRQILPIFVNHFTTENIRIFFGGTHPAHKIFMKTEHFL